MSESLEAVPRPDWRESLALAADLALLGVVTTLACLPVVTAGAALATASAAASHACVHRGLPSLGELWQTFRRALLPGLAATAVAIVACGLFTLDIRALAAGVVPGGTGLLVLTAVLAAAALGVGLVGLVRVGLTGGSGWRAGLRWAAGQPRAVGLALPILAVPVVLAMTVPVTTLLLPGFLLFALHVMVRRTCGVPAES